MKDIFSEYLFKNFSLKLLSLFLGVIFYIVIQTQQVREVSKTARLKIIAPESMMVVGAYERLVEVTLRFPNSIFNEAPADEDLFGELNLSSQRVGKIRLRLSRENFPRLDRRFGLVIHDPWMEIELDNVVTRELKVIPTLEGEPKRFHDIEKVVVEPATVFVTGAAQDVRNLQNIATSPVNIEGIDQNFSSLAGLILEDHPSARLNTDKVKVQVSTILAAQKREFKNIRVLGFGRRRFNPETVTVTLQGKKELLAAVVANDIIAYIDFREGQTLQKIIVRVPEGIEAMKVIPEFVEVR